MKAKTDDEFDEFIFLTKETNHIFIKLGSHVFQCVKCEKILIRNDVYTYAYIDPKGNKGIVIDQEGEKCN